VPEKKIGKSLLTHTALFSLVSLDVKYYVNMELFFTSRNRVHNMQHTLNLRLFNVVFFLQINDSSDVECEFK
jgi:hypothetical protein